MKKDVLKKNNSKKVSFGIVWTKAKVITVVIAALSCIFLIIGGIFLTKFLLKNDPKKQNDVIFYYRADYDENIYENAAYIGMDRLLRYSSLGLEQSYSFDEDFDAAPLECRFFLNYFKTVIDGDYEEVTAFYVDDYFKKPPRFTMQMIFDTHILYHSSEDIELENGDDATLLNFVVRYRIFKNNGTFRSGIRSGDAVPQIYQVIKKNDGSMQIYRILDVEFVDEAE